MGEITCSYCKKTYRIQEKLLRQLDMAPQRGSRNEEICKQLGNDTSPQNGKRVLLKTKGNMPELRLQPNIYPRTPGNFKGVPLKKRIRKIGEVKKNRQNNAVPELLTMTLQGPKPRIQMGNIYTSRTRWDPEAGKEPLEKTNGSYRKHRATAEKTKVRTRRRKWRKSRTYEQMNAVKWPKQRITRKVDNDSARSDAADEKKAHRDRSQENREAGAKAHKAENRKSVNV